jgi:SAM-dependent methyltransferase
MSTWEGTRVSADRTHHLHGGEPLYSARFMEVLSFHAPGLAAAKDATGAFHIDTSGRSSYARRFTRTFGFYEGLAAVERAEEAFHIRPDGTELYAERYGWCGNFQGGRCTVREQGAGTVYLHIDATGQPVYPERYAYAGDYREGIAVVQEASGLHLHIDREGRPLNGRRYLDLDVFHKGYARARDSRGWHHVDPSGEPLYARRFAAVEPFYNGKARVEREDGALEIIDERGKTVCELRGPRRSELQALSADMVGFWRTQTLAAAAELGVIQGLPGTPEQVAERRGLPVGGCARLLRALGELGLVSREGAVWRATERGALLHPEHPQSLWDAARHWGRDCYRLWEELPTALRGAGGWKPPRFFEGLAQDERRVESYHRAMASYARHDHGELSEVLPELTSGTVLDAGGGTGALLHALLRRRPELRGVLLDLSEVIWFAELPLDLRGRLEARAGDLFEPWGVRADAVFLARVLHDWDDAEALRILGRAREALNPGGRLYIVELVLGTADEDMGGGLLDLHMLVTTGGRERTEAQLRTLLERAGLRLIERRDTARSIRSILIGAAA